MLWPAPSLTTCDRVNRPAVGRQIPNCIGLGAGTFAQHVVAETQTILFLSRASGLPQGLAHVAAQDKLAAHELNGTDGGGHHGLRAQTLEQTWRLSVGCVGQEFFGQRDRIGRQTGEQFVRARAAALAAVKLGATELVCRQGDGGGGVRHTQQGFSQAHQGQTFGAADRVLAQQGLHRPKGSRVVTHRLHPGACTGQHRRPRQSVLQ